LCNGAWAEIGKTNEIDHGIANLIKRNYNFCWKTLFSVAMMSRNDLDAIQVQLKISIQNHQVSEPCQLSWAYFGTLPHFRKYHLKIPKWLTGIYLEQMTNRYVFFIKFI
jgi:hypothetical protein